MPAERRHIIFRPAEYLHALQEYCRRIGRPFSADRVLRSAISEDCGVSIVMNAQAGEQTLYFRADEVLAALILWCITNRVPMPAKCPKALRQIADNLAITLEIEIPARMGVFRLAGAAG